ncbi:hypothetical protein D3C81_1668490 [compost metagenome]
MPVAQSLALQLGDDAQRQLRPHAVGAPHRRLVLARHRRRQFPRRQDVQHAQRRLRPHALNGQQDGEGPPLVPRQKTIEARPRVLAPLAMDIEGRLVARSRQTPQGPRPAGRDIAHPAAVDQAFRLPDLGQHASKTPDHAAPLRLAFKLKLRRWWAWVMATASASAASAFTSPAAGSSRLIMKATWLLSA